MSMGASLIGKALNFGFNEYGFESRAPNVSYSYNYSISYLVNQVNLSAAHRTLFFTAALTKSTLMFIQIFKEFGLIRRYVVVMIGGKASLKVYLNYYKNSAIGCNFKLMTRPSKQFSISLQALRLLAKRSGRSTFILSTSYGLLSHHQAITRKIGGVLLGSISM